MESIKCVESNSVKHVLSRSVYVKSRTWNSHEITVNFLLWKIYKFVLYKKNFFFFANCKYTNLKRENFLTHFVQVNYGFKPLRDEMFHSSIHKKSSKGSNY